jgi:hypothetical protein
MPADASTPTPPGDAPPDGPPPAVNVVIECGQGGACACIHCPLEAAHAQETVLDARCDACMTRIDAAFRRHVHVLAREAAIAVSSPPPAALPSCGARCSAALVEANLRGLVGAPARALVDGMRASRVKACSFSVLRIYRDGDSLSVEVRIRQTAEEVAAGEPPAAAINPQQIQATRLF